MYSEKVPLYCVYVQGFWLNDADDRTGKTKHQEIFYLLASSGQRGRIGKELETIVEPIVKQVIRKVNAMR